MKNKRIRLLLPLLAVVVVLSLVFVGFAAAGIDRSHPAQSEPTSTPLLQDAGTVIGIPPSDVIVLPEFLPQASPYTFGIPRLALLETIIPTRPRVDVITYTVQTGDNLFSIADRYGLRPETVLWGNFDVLQDNPQFLKPGQILNILPVDGTYYQWSGRDSIDAISNFFGVTEVDILEYPGNLFDLFELTAGEPEITAGTWLIVPGGRRALQDWGPPAITRDNPASAAYYGSGSCGQIYSGAVGTGSFVWPTVSRSISGYDYNPDVHPGLDMAGPEGNSVYATDSGVVVYAGWSEFGYGYLIVIDHGTGWQSAYAHLSGVGVTCGQSVALGTVIGAVGNTGNSTGPHLHFELRSEIFGKVNPWNYLIP